MNRLKGKVVLITGAASGIGISSALRFAGEGATIIGFDRNPAVRVGKRLCPVPLIVNF